MPWAENLPMQVQHTYCMQHLTEFFFLNLKKIICPIKHLFVQLPPPFSLRYSSQAIPHPTWYLDYTCAPIISCIHDVEPYLMPQRSIGICAKMERCLLITAPFHSIPTLMHERSQQVFSMQMQSPVQYQIHHRAQPFWLKYKHWTLKRSGYFVVATTYSLILLSLHPTITHN